jgi:CSLREA domain-containing protein
MRTRSLSRFNRFIGIAALSALIASAAHVTPARAAGIIVTTGADNVNAGDGLCSLREAITAANANTASGPGAGECAAGSSSGTDTISFADNYTITLSPGLGQLPVVTSPMTVNGKGAAQTVIQAHAAPDTATMRVFHVESGSSLTLNALTVRHGRCNGHCSITQDLGGGILNGGTLTVTNSVVSGNWANFGGGIFNLDTLIVKNSVVSGNSANNGGGIASAGTLRVMNSTISGNSATSLGGGVDHYAETLTVTNSTFSGNSASSGGGIAYGYNATFATVTNSTFSGNSAAVNGGGIYSFFATIMTVTNSTISGSSANVGGGGIHKDAGEGTVTLQNTIVANSVAGGNCGGTIANDGNNLDSGATCGWGSDNGSQSNVDPKLGALASNGGLTQTMALLSGSPAIDTGADAGCPATDQRGFARPQGAHCDIGAYESPSVTTLRSGGAQDGWVLETSENSNQGGVINASAATFLLGDDAGNRQYRSILHFNTSSLPDNAVITRVVLKIKKQGVTGTDPFTTHLKIAVDIRKGAFSNLGALQATDFQAAASMSGAGSFANNPTPSGWYATRLKTTAYPYINRTGVTQFRLRFQTDDDNDTVADFIRFFSGNYTAADQPVLVIEYSVP